MSTNGILDFQGTNKATFVGENSNVVIDTVNASFGIGVDVNGPTSNLHVVGNAYVTTELSVGGELSLARLVDVGTNSRTRIGLGSGGGTTINETNQIAIGEESGYNNQGQDAIAIGRQSGWDSQSSNTVAIGTFAGAVNQSSNAVAVGYQSGNVNQSLDAVAIGYQAGQSSQGDRAVAIGNGAGRSGSQGQEAIAIGNESGNWFQSSKAVAVGTFAGKTAQGNSAIAVGYLAGETDQGDNSIILNATGVALDSTTASSFHVKPVRGGNFAASALAYTSTGEIVEETNTHFDTNGNVGIGTTSPEGKLDIRGSVSDPSIPTVHIGDNAVDFGDYGMVNLVRNPTESGTKAHLAFIRNGNTIFSQGYYNNTNTFGFWPSFSSVANTPAMAFATNGKVGIGTTSPGARLHVYDGVGTVASEMILGPNAAADQAGIVKYFHGDGSGTGYTIVGNWGDSMSSGTGLVVKKGGNVGIGTTSPMSKLNVQGTISTGRNLAREVGSVIAYSSQYQSARGAANVINGIKNFEIGDSDWITSGGNRVNAYVVIDLGASYSVDRLVIYNQNEYSDSKREVKQFKLQGSTDNSTWVDVIGSECGRSNADEPNPGWSFRIPQSWDADDEGSSSYRYWKFIMETFHGTDSYGGIMELELYENNEAVHSEVSTSSLVARDVYSEMGNFSRGVGIGTTSPSRKLEVVGGPTKSDGFILGTSNNVYYPGCIYTDSNWGMLFRSAVSSPAIADFVFNDYAGSNMMVINNGNVGINQNSPTAKLHIKPNHTSYSNPSGPVGAAGVAVYNETNSDPTITHSIISLRTGGTSGGDPFVSFDVAGEHGWSVGIDNSEGRQLRFGESWANFSSTRAYISPGSTAAEIDFTGQHRSFVSNVPHTEYLNLEGLIVSANKNQYFDIQEEIVTGVQAIKINESLPLVSISNVAYDKSCFGVISGSEDTNDREYSQGSFVSVLKKQEGDIRAHINSVGEGAIWVTNLNGTLESGDYITTSNVAGYGQKQDSEFLANYTVAKITMDCDFEPTTQPVQIIKKELQDVNYWVKYTYDDISEEEYTRVKNLGRRVRIIEGGTEISQEEYENHVKKEGYTITESNTYIRNDTTYQRVFSDKEKEPKEGYELEVRNEPVNVLDEHGQIQWEDTDETEKAYKIRYLDADGNITDEANAVHTAAFVGCTYHCG